MYIIAVIPIPEFFFLLTTNFINIYNIHLHFILGGTITKISSIFFKLPPIFRYGFIDAFTETEDLIYKIYFSMFCFYSSNFLSIEIGWLKKGSHSFLFKSFNAHCSFWNCTNIRLAVILMATTISFTPVLIPWWYTISTLIKTWTHVVFCHYFHFSIDKKY